MITLQYQSFLAKCSDKYCISDIDPDNSRYRFRYEILETHLRRIALSRPLTEHNSKSRRSSQRVFKSTPLQVRISWPIALRSFCKFALRGGWVDGLHMRHSIGY